MIWKASTFHNIAITAPHIASIAGSCGHLVEKLCSNAVIAPSDVGKRVLECSSVERMTDIAIVLCL
jgi:hypothetical protein